MLDEKARAVSGWSWLLAVIFLVSAVLETGHRYSSATYNGELLNREYKTSPVSGDEVLEYGFKARHDSLKGLWVFIDVPTATSVEEGRLMVSIRRETEAKPFCIQSLPCRANDARGGISLLLRFPDGTRLKEGGRYVMQYSMPEMKPGTVWRLHCLITEDPGVWLKQGGKVQIGTEPEMLWLACSPHRPWWHLGASIVLASLWWWRGSRGTRVAGPMLITLASGCMVAAAYRWQTDLWQFWGCYWPDGYPALSKTLYHFFSGAISFRDALTYFQQFRCGQAFGVPLIMASFQCAGLTVKVSYLACNCVCFVVLIALYAGFLRMHGIREEKPVMLAWLMFFGSRCLVLAVGEMDTDIAGLMATLLFAYLFLRGFAAEENARIAWYSACGVAAMVASVIRPALMGLLPVSACLFLWSLFCEREKPLRERAAYLIPTIVGVSLLFLCWSDLGLWGSFNKQFENSRSPEPLSWKCFLITTLKGMNYTLVVIALEWRRRLFKERSFAMVAGSLAGLVGLLVFVHPGPSLRYTAPPSMLGVVLCLWAVKEWPQRERLLTAFAWVGLLYGFVAV
jgi:hypothetical protein